MLSSLEMHGHQRKTVGEGHLHTIGTYYCSLKWMIGQLVFNLGELECNVNN